MTEKKVWFITGAGRGMGVDIATAALAAGNAAVATGRNPDAVAKAVGQAADLLVVTLDSTSPADAQAKVVERQGQRDACRDLSPSLALEEASPWPLGHDTGTPTEHITVWEITS